MVLAPEVLHIDFGNTSSWLEQVLGTLMTNDKCQQQQQEQQLLPLYDLGFAAGNNNH